MLHLLLHAVVPLLIALSLSRKEWLKTWLILMATMLVDLDHLLASPIYDPNRCSIGFHPMHQWFAILLYGLLCVLPTRQWAHFSNPCLNSILRNLRWVGLGLIIHMALDSIDCQVTNGVWYQG